MGRAPCCDDISELKKGPWTPEEDELLVSYIQKHGLGSWRALPKAAGLNRCGKSCRLRWTNYLRPDIKRGCFTEEEEDMIIKLHSVLGNKWSRIAAHLPGRTDNEIKNYWNTHLRKKLLQMGIDPVTHKPRNDLNLLANLSQLLSTTQNLGPMMNPWDINNALRIQPNAAAESLSSTTTYETLDENKLPSLVNISPEVSTVNQIESNTNSTNGFSALGPTTDGFFEGWDKLLDDGNSDFWKQFIK
uniref:Uncharacterized protein n=1 Tax=Chenopodium quinoa TaxID=63459 RepID=A0A803LTZ9_CHEQI